MTNDPPPHSGELSSQVAIVTGATSGIGAGIASELARRGASVVLGGRRAEAGRAIAEQLLADGGRAVFVPCDVSRVADCEHLIGVAVSEFGGCDVLVNNAGTPGDPPVEPSHAVSEATWDEVIATNLKGAFFCATAAIKQMRTSGGGHIVNIASTTAILPQARMAAYSVSKAGLVQLTRALAVEYLRERIRVNCVVLGSVQTNLTTRVTNGILASAGDDPRVTALAAAPQAGSGSVPLGRLQVTDVARFVAALCGADMHELTAAVIPLDRAMTAGLAESQIAFMRTTGRWAGEPDW